MCSARVAESLAHEHLLAGLPSTVILNAVQLAYFSVRRIEYPAPRHWGMVARLDALKDHATLIKAAALIVKRFPDFRLTIVGEGLSRPYIEQLVRDHDLSDVVTLVGVANKPWELMKGWEGAIFSTGPKEGFGIAAAEAMAMGLPCVFTDLPAIREVGGAAVLYAQAGSPESLAEQVGQLISNPDYAYRLGQAAAFRAQKFFSPSSFAAAYLRNFDS
jgi:glycosyltransferase involved in cell wall biosynthesis